MYLTYNSNVDLLVLRKLLHKYNHNLLYSNIGSIFRKMDLDMGRRRKNSKGDLFVGLAVLFALSFILNSEASKNVLISTFQVLMVILLIGFVISILFKKKSASTKSYHSVDEQNKKPELNQKLTL